MVSSFLRLLATLCAIAACVSLGVSASRLSPSCALVNAPPHYTFIGGGFHMQLALEFPVAAKDVSFTFDLPKSFFIDEAEAEQLYRMEVLATAPSAQQGLNAVVLQDTTAAYAPLKMTSQYFFDIEAPVFKVNYSTNHVELSFQQRPETTALDTFLEAAGEAGPVTARLVIPIHSRYDTLDTTTKFSLRDFVMGESAYVPRCLPAIALKGTADERCSGKAFASTATEASVRAQGPYQPCLDLPVGVLDDLPFIYRALMALLVAGAVIVIVAIR